MENPHLTRVMYKTSKFTIKSVTCNFTYDRINYFNPKSQLNHKIRFQVKITQEHNIHSAHSYQPLYGSTDAN